MLHEGITNNISYIYNGIFQPAEISNNIFLTGKNILCIARLAPPKRADLFVDIAKKLPEYNFIWIGNQNEPDIEFPENVRFIGNIQNAGAYIRYADLFMLISDYEGLPMVIIEALACGVPVIASKVGGVTELLNGKNGFALENNADIMASKVKEFMSLDKKFQKGISDNALMTYNKFFTVDKMTDGYLNIYNRIAK